MNPLGLFGNRRFILAVSSMLAFLFIVLAGKLLLAGNEGIYTLLSDLASVLSALVAALLFSGVWIRTKNTDRSRRIWGQIAIGMLLWMIAEGIWAFYEVILNRPVPYPSLADALWLLGYIPIYFALYIRYRSFRSAQPTLRQRFVIAFLALLFSSLIIYYILVPIVQSFDPGRLLESLLNIAYPLFDLILLILTMVIVFSLEQGRFSFTWRLFGLGFVAMAAADLMFSYASWNEIYYPDGHLNIVSLLIDMSYYVSYLVLGLGIYSYWLLSVSQQTVKMNIVLRSLTQSNILVFLDRQGRILSFSDNLRNLLRASDDVHFEKRLLGEVLNIETAAWDSLLARMFEQGSLSMLPVTIGNADVDPKDIWLTSFKVNDEQGNFYCIAVVLRANLDLDGAREQPLNQEQQMLVRYYLTQAGTYRGEENRVIKAYFLEQVSLLYALTGQYSGAPAAGRLLAYLNQVAEKNNWPFLFNGREISIPEEYEGQTLAECVSVLLREARDFAANMVNLNVVEHEINALDENLSSENLQYIDKYALRGPIKPPASSGFNRKRPSFSRL